MKKAIIILMSLLAMMVASLSAMAQEITITLFPGWNWISYPNAEVMDIASALGDFTPVQGDIISSQYGFSTYTNGRWRGSVTHFISGWGYKYYSARTEEVEFAFAYAETSNVVVTTSEPTDITATSAVVGGTVTIDQGNHIFVRGVCWSTEPNPDIDGSHTSNGTGIGSFSDTLTELTSNTTYYVRAYMVTNYGLAYGEELSFTTEGGSGDHAYVDLGLPSGTLWATCNVGANNPVDYGDYFAWGETQPKDDYSWSTYQYNNGSFGNALTKYCTKSSYGYNGFTDNLTTLQPEDDAATANWGNDWRMPTKEEWQELRNNTTIIWTAQNGVYGRLFTAANGNSIFLPAAGFRTDDLHYYAGSFGDYWSSSLNTIVPDGAWGLDFGSGNEYNLSGYSRASGFTVRPVRSTSQVMSYTIDATANPAESGEVSGGGTYQEGTECTLTATVSEGYIFTNWTENGDVVSTEATYSFTVTSDRTLIANFTTNGGGGNGNAPTGAINGLFTINDRGDQVYFSQGNLQYQASTNTWRFAENQWDFVGTQNPYYGNPGGTITGSDNSNISSTYSGWIDLFGWGTSNWNNGNIYYHPWDYESEYYFLGFGYGPTDGTSYSYDLTGSYANADWGVYNPIINGGNIVAAWRTLTNGEWDFVLNTRNTVSGYRYVRAQVNNIKGIILLPDDWNTNIYSLNNPNTYNSSFSSNEISASQWTTLENAGAIFLPAAGSRDGTSVSVNSYGGYWSSSCFDVYAFFLVFYDGQLILYRDGLRFMGRSVRLVCNVE